MRIALGRVVRDKVTGFVGVAENVATYMYGCDRYYVQPFVDGDGKVPDGRMVDDPQLVVVEGKAKVMDLVKLPAQLVEMGQLVKDPIAGVEGTVIGRAIYLNGCSRVLIQMKQINGKIIEPYWVDEKQVEPQQTFLGKKKITKEPDNQETRFSGGPVPKSSKY